MKKKNRPGNLVETGRLFVLKTASFQYFIWWRRRHAPYQRLDALGVRYQDVDSSIVDTAKSRIECGLIG